MTVICNGTLVSPKGVKKGNLAVENGRIVRIGMGVMPRNGDEIVDASSCLVFPGFIDAHTHLDMDNGVTRTADDFYSGGRAAIAGGTTCIIDFATQEKGGSLQQALDDWQKKAHGRTSCDYGFHMAITDWNSHVKAEIPQMAKQGVTSFKLYMAYENLRVTDAEILDILQAVKAVNGTLGVHCENGDLVCYLSDRLKEKGKTTPSAHPKSRPPQVEAEAVNRLLYLSELAGWPVHIVHLSSKAALDEVRIARGRGQRVFVESCPQYFLLDDSRYEQAGFEGAKYVISPPLRSAWNGKVLGEALQAGEIDTIATDHCSYRFSDQKTLGKDDFTKIPSGAPGLEYRPALMYSYFVHSGLITPEALCEVLCENPAKLFGLYPQKGCLELGSDADLVIWQPDVQMVIDAAKGQDNCDYSPYQGMQVQGMAKAVFLRGEKVVSNGKPVLENTGQYQSRKGMWQEG